MTTLYQQLGGDDGIARLVDAFLACLDNAPFARPLRSLYRESREHYRIRMNAFLSGWLGGPLRYHEQFGMPMLKENHRRIPISHDTALLWMACMREALDEIVADDSLSLPLAGAFWHMAQSLENR